MINLWINYEIKNLEELEKVLTLLNNNKDLGIKPKLNIDTQNIKSVDNKICNKCWNKLRIVPAWVNKLWKSYWSFKVCDNCNPRRDSKFSNNIKSTPDHIDCPNCWDLIPETNGIHGSFYECRTCKFKIDPRKKDFSNFISN